MPPYPVTVRETENNVFSTQYLLCVWLCAKVRDTTVSKTDTVILLEIIF